MKTQVTNLVVKAKENATLKAFNEQCVYEYFMLVGIGAGVLGAFMPLVNFS